MNKFFVKEFTNTNAKVVFCSYDLCECKELLKYEKVQALIKSNNKKYDIIDESGCSVL